MAADGERDLRPATRSDVQPGSTVFVLGKEALVDSVDWPIVFYKFADRPGLKNRSFAAWPAAFEVEANPEPEEFQFAVSSMEEGEEDEVQHDDAGGDESWSPDSPQGEGAAGGGGAEESPLSRAAVSRAHAAGGEPGGAGAGGSVSSDAMENISRAFSNRPPRKEIVEVNDDDDVACHLNRGQAVLVKRCSNTEIRLDGRCAAVTIMECNNVFVKCADRVLGVVELFRCSNVRVHAQARTFRLERTQDTCIDVCQGDNEGNDGAPDTVYTPWTVLTTQSVRTRVGLTKSPNEDALLHYDVEEPDEDEEDEEDEEGESKEGAAGAAGAQGKEAEEEDDDDVVESGSALRETDLKTPHSGQVFATRQRLDTGRVETFRVDGFGDEV